MSDTVTSLTCPCCAQKDRHAIIVVRQSVPTLQNVILKTQAEAQNFTTGSLEMRQCRFCSFVWNAAFDPDAIVYDASYNNDVSSSAFYNDHLVQRAEALVAAVPEDKRIHMVEIGCGNGDFIKLVAERAQGRLASAIGFDPSYKNRDDLPPGVTIHREYFGPHNYDRVDPNCNVVVSRHTIEHVPQPRPFIESIARFVDGRDIPVFIETPTVDWIFENNAFYDFFYEHCSLFNAPSVKALLHAFGFAAQVEPVYGGQYFWAQTHPSANVADEASSVKMAVARSGPFRAESQNIVDRWSKRIAAKRPGARIGIWGAASKGVTFALIMQQHGQTIDFAIDMNPDKQGCYMPVIGLPIQAPDDVMLTEDDTVIVMNPNYCGEIAAQLSAMRAPSMLEVL